MDNEKYEPAIDENGAYVDVDIQEASIFHVECSCGALVISDKSKEEAIAAWNRRATERAKRKHSPRKVVFGIIAALGFFAMIGFCAADALTYAERMAYSVAGLLGFMVGAGVAGALGDRKEDKQDG